MRSSLKLAVVALVAGIFLGFLVPTLLATDEPAAPLRIHTVKAGETLWGLAKTYAPQGDPREFVFEVQRLNGLEGVVLQPGLTLTLPSAN